LLTQPGRVAEAAAALWKRERITGLFYESSSMVWRDELLQEKIVAAIAALEAGDVYSSTGRSLAPASDRISSRI